MGERGGVAEKSSSSALPSFHKRQFGPFSTLLRFYETMRSVGEVCPVSCTRVEALSALNTPLHVPRFLQLSSVDDVIPALTRHLI